MKTLKTLALFMLAVTLSNCSKNDDATSQIPQEESIRLKNYTKDDVNFDMTYNENNQLFKYQYGNSSSKVTLTLQYDEEGNITKNGYGYTYNTQGNIADINSSYLNAVLNYNTEGQLKSMNSHYTYTTTDITATTNFEYDSNNRLYIINEYSNDVTASPYAKTTLTYDANGNITQKQIKRSNDGIDFYLFQTTTYTYDTKNNPFFNVVNHAGLKDAVSIQDFVSLRTLAFGGQIGKAYLNFYSPNNLLTEENSLKIVTYNYTYNEDEYPITLMQTTEHVGGSTYSYSLTFTYETY